MIGEKKTLPELQETTRLNPPPFHLVLAMGKI